MKRIAYSLLVATALMSGPAMANDEYQFNKHGRYNYAYGTDRHYETRQVIHLTGTDIANLQRALSANGYNPGPIDGVFGTRTRAALTGFQYDRELQGEGNITERTLQALDVSLVRERTNLRYRRGYN